MAAHETVSSSESGRDIGCRRQCRAGYLRKHAGKAWRRHSDVERGLLGLRSWSRRLQTWLWLHTWLQTGLQTGLHSWLYTWSHTLLHTWLYTWSHTLLHTWLHTWAHTWRHTWRHTWAHTLLYQERTNHAWGV